jgi:hypothetical protein
MGGGAWTFVYSDRNGDSIYNWVELAPLVAAAADEVVDDETFITSSTGVRTLTAAVKTQLDAIPSADGATIQSTLGVLSARAASATATGIVELATVDEAKTGTDTERAVTPAGLAAALAALKTEILALIPAADGTTITDTSHVFSVSVPSLITSDESTGTTVSGQNPAAVVFWPDA